MTFRFYDVIKSKRLSFLGYDLILSLKIVLIFAKSADPDEIQHNPA